MKPRTKIGALLVCTVGLLHGCAIVSSSNANGGGEGIGYMLPRALLPVELVHDGTSFELRITSPVLVGDTAHVYALQRSGNVFSSDNIVVNVDPATGLLSGIDVKSDDQSASALVKLASGLRAESRDLVAELVVFRELFDPQRTNAANFNTRLNNAAIKHVERLQKEYACSGAAAGTCKTLAALSEDLKAVKFTVTLDGGADAKSKRNPDQSAEDKGAANAAKGGADTPPQGETSVQADCRAGFCYRINVPHIVTLSGPGVSNSAVFGLPNRSPTFVMPLERWAFVKTSHDVKLEGGVFKSSTTDRPSSAFAVASLPFDIAKGAVSAASELIQLKLDLSGKEKAFADAKVAELQAKQALEKALLDKAKGTKAEAALLGLPSTDDSPQLSIRVGVPSQLDATKDLNKPTRAKKNGNANPTEAKTPAAAPQAASVPAGGQASPGSSGTVDKKN